MYSNWLQARVTRATTVYYVADVRQYLVWLNQQGVKVELATLTDLQRYVSALGEKAIPGDGSSPLYADTTIGRKVSALRTFHGALLALGHIASNPACQLRRPHSRPKPNSPRPSVETLLTSLPVTEVPSPRHIRDMAVLALSVHEQLRIGEIARLNVTDVDLKAGLVHVTGRPPHRLTAFLSQATAQVLSRWLAVRRLVASGRDEAVFISLHWTSGRSIPGTRISRRGLSRILHAYRRARRS